MTGPSLASGVFGAQASGGSGGEKGWSPVLAVVVDDERRVHQVIDWTGGQGSKPATGRYIGSTGLVIDIADAVDIRGGQGNPGEDGEDGDPGEPGAPGAPGVVQSLVAGTNITIDDTDPANPVINASGGGGSGDVVGPASSINNRIVLFDGTTGKFVKDGGSLLSDFVTTASLGSGVATFLATPSSANLAAAVTGETGTGALVFGTSPTLVTPVLGTPASVTLTNGTGLPISTGVSGLGTGVATFLATPSSANLRAALTDEVGTGSAYFVGGALGTPASVTLTNGTGLPIGTGVSGLGTGVATFLATPSSANLRAALTDEVGTGAAYFVGGALGTPASATLSNATGYPAATDTTTGVVELATPSEVRSAATGDKAIVTQNIEDASAWVTLTDASTIALDFDTFINGVVTVTANRAFGNPTNPQDGVTRYVLLKGSDATARTISFGSNFKGDLPTQTVTSTSWLLIGMTPASSTHIIVTSAKGL